MTAKKSNRIEIIDALRGIIIVIMILFHLLYDIEAIFGIQFQIMQPDITRIILAIFPTCFFIISGVCTAFSRSILKRGLTLFIIGNLITLVTILIIPEQKIIFGAISSIGCCMLLYCLVKNILDKIPCSVSVAIFFFLFVAFYEFWYSHSISLIFTRVHFDFIVTNNHLYAFGLPHKDFFSTDYFPLLPYFFSFIVGTALSKPIFQKKFPQWFYTTKMPIINKIGKYSLVIYIVHQPLIYFTLTMINKFKG